MGQLKVMQLGRGGRSSYLLDRKRQVKVTGHHDHVTATIFRSTDVKLSIHAAKNPFKMRDIKGAALSTHIPERAAESERFEANRRD